MRESIVGRGRLIQGNTQVDLDRRPGDSHLFDQQAHEFLTLLKIKAIDAVTNTLGEGVEPAR
ncbi:MAG: hypothetical protein JO352_34985 [Chloroflexi bacterium]|nr:hypothetical protein [Chloroflexota bacterium]